MEYDFIIVGAGAGGGPLAANLSLAGFSVLLIDAGGDPNKDHDKDKYNIPAFHALSTEDPDYSWEYFVDHYSDPRQAIRDPKFQTTTRDPNKKGVFYPRATGLGGCTAHHALITVYPHEGDWNHIAEITGDESWRAENMWEYFDRIEEAQYPDGSKLLNLLRPQDILKELFNKLRGEKNNESGWLTLTQADPTLLLKDLEGITKVVKAAIKIALKEGLSFMPGLNPNHPLVASKNKEGINIIPISVRDGKRHGPRERVLDAIEVLKENPEIGGVLDIAKNTFVESILFDKDDTTRAIGVKCLEGQHLYKATHHDVSLGTVKKKIEYFANKEVILSAGAFNTPQLLMLSGIGSERQLKEKNIPFRIKSEGVGKNLQDRYEVGIVARADAPFDLLKGANFGRDPDIDPAYQEWKKDHSGVYATNGSVLGIIKRSSTQPKDDPPDLYIFGVPGLFRGYVKGYSEVAVKNPDHFTWAVLKGHTDNVSGEVKLRSNRPLDTPEINFKYFNESAQNPENDLQSVVDGVEFVLKITDKLIKKKVFSEVLAPLKGEDLYQFVKDNAWGHHASCTCKIGSDDDSTAVLDENFQVRGAKNLRVVDASVFPRIPGLFIVSSVYIVAEKASDIIISKYL